MKGVGRNHKDEGKKKGGLKVHMLTDIYAGTPISHLDLKWVVTEAGRGYHKHSKSRNKSSTTAQMSLSLKGG